MKLAITNITHDESRVKGTAAVELDYLIAPVTLCSFPVSVDYVVGKSLEQYLSELEEEARSTVKNMYADIICGGVVNDELIITLRGKMTSDHIIKIYNRDGKLSATEIEPVPQETAREFAGNEILMNECRIAPTTISKELSEQIPDITELEKRITTLEKRSGEQVGPGDLKAIYTIADTAIKRLLQEEAHSYNYSLNINVNASEPPSDTRATVLDSSTKIEGKIRNEKITGSLRATIKL